MGNPRYDPFRRHYKKDTRFLLDLYTLTYDSGESLCAGDSKVGQNLDKVSYSRRCLERYFNVPLAFFFFLGQIVFFLAPSVVYEILSYGSWNRQ